MLSIENLLLVVLISSLITNAILGIIKLDIVICFRYRCTRFQGKAAIIVSSILIILTAYFSWFFTAMKYLDINISELIPGIIIGIPIGILFYRYYIKKIPYIKNNNSNNFNLLITIITGVSILTLIGISLVIYFSSK